MTRMASVDYKGAIFACGSSSPFYIKCSRFVEMCRRWQNISKLSIIVFLHIILCHLSAAAGSFYQTTRQKCLFTSHIYSYISFGVNALPASQVF